MVNTLSALALALANISILVTVQPLTVKSRFAKLDRVPALGAWVRAPPRGSKICVDAVKAFSVAAKAKTEPPPGPTGPVAPVAPVAPVRPTPVAPGTPCGPCAPVAPVAHDGPAGPAGPPETNVTSNSAGWLLAVDSLLSRTTCVEPLARAAVIAIP